MGSALRTRTLGFRACCGAIASPITSQSRARYNDREGEDLAEFHHKLRHYPAGGGKPGFRTSTSRFSTGGRCPGQAVGNRVMGYCFLPHEMLRGFTDFEYAPPTNEPDLGRCLASTGALQGAHAQCADFARYMLSGYLEVQPFGRTPLRRLYFFAQPRFSFGATVPQISYPQTFAPIACENFMGFGVELSRSFEPARRAAHRVLDGPLYRLSGPRGSRHCRPLRTIRHRRRALEVRLGEPRSHDSMKPRSTGLRGVVWPPVAGTGSCRLWPTTTPTRPRSTKTWNPRRGRRRPWKNGTGADPHL